ncbi:hypothetical protein DFH09DRAFT_338701 [Mycena vulgaris]|nr:hypothetical protein DFH09DRAFT_338701 [Mycena vulgaris]
MMPLHAPPNTAGYEAISGFHIGGRLIILDHFKSFLCYADTHETGIYFCSPAHRPGPASGSITGIKFLPNSASCDCNLCHLLMERRRPMLWTANCLSAVAVNWRRISSQSTITCPPGTTPVYSTLDQYRKHGRPYFGALNHLHFGLLAPHVVIHLIASSHISVALLDGSIPTLFPKKCGSGTDNRKALAILSGSTLPRAAPSGTPLV